MNLGMTPLKALYARKYPPTLIRQPFTTNDLEVIRDQLANRDGLLAKLKQKLAMEQQKDETSSR